jgi:hypothetical protein
MDMKRLVAVLAGLLAGAAFAAATESRTRTGRNWSPANIRSTDIRRNRPPANMRNRNTGRNGPPPPSGPSSYRPPVTVASPPATKATGGSVGPTAPAVQSGGGEDFPVGVIVGGAAIAAVVVLVLVGWAFRWRAHAIHVPRLRIIEDPGSQRVEPEPGRPLVAVRAMLDPAEITPLNQEHNDDNRL